MNTRTSTSTGDSSHGDAGYTVSQQELQLFPGQVGEYKTSRDKFSKFICFKTDLAH